MSAEGPVFPRNRGGSPSTAVISIYVSPLAAWMLSVPDSCCHHAVLCTSWKVWKSGIAWRTSSSAAVTVRLRETVVRDAEQGLHCTGILMMFRQQPRLCTVAVQTLHPLDIVTQKYYFWLLYAFLLITGFSCCTDWITLGPCCLLRLSQAKLDSILPKGSFYQRLISVWIYIYCI